jgi:RNA polymerase sigma factor (sigma-70 family)
MTQKEYEDFAVKYLNFKSPGLLKCDYNTVVGELVSAMMTAEPHLNTNISNINTYFSMVCRNRLLNFLRRERRFYGKHVMLSDMTDFQSKDRGPAVQLQKEELKRRVQSTALPAKTKEVVLLYIENPFVSNAELARQLGISRQCVGAHISSARQYLSRRNVSLE